ncbi:MAG: TolC family protein [Muribaculaceae bacterium]|nr:TolC family protein [Muribaculaceae bacterium]
MWKKVFAIIAALALLPGVMRAQAVQWTLDECVRYALENNITLKKNVVSMRSANEDLLQSQSALFPSLSFGTSHSVGYSPWKNNSISSVADGMVADGASKGYYNGSYSLSANWTVWDGNRNRNQVKLNQVLKNEAELDSAVTANMLQEQIAQYYVQAQYLKEAIVVAENSLEVSRAEEERGRAFVEVGSMSKADLAQLVAQRSQDEYTLVEARSALSICLINLKQVLELPGEMTFDVASVSVADAQVLAEVPALQQVYENAVNNRPEVKRGLMAIEGSKIQEKIAKANYMPSIGLSAGVGSGTNTMNNSGWGEQFKSNFDMQVGVTASIPLYDQRQAKTAVNKARLQQEQSYLDLQDTKKTLYFTLENYWEQAVTNQQKFVAAQANVASRQASFELLEEQFNLGLKNVVELMTSKSNLLEAQQSMLQSKYTTIYNLQMLKFYQKQ